MTSFLLRPARLAQWLLPALAFALTCHAAVAEPLVQVYAIRGFAGVMFSRGMNQLCDELARIPRVACAVADFHEEAALERRGAAAIAAGQRLVLVGHSLGAHAALRVAAAMPGDVPLIVTIDPNWFPEPPLVPPNARTVLNYYQDGDVLGRARLQPGMAFRGELHQFLRREAHVLIDRSPEIHSAIVSHTRSIVANLTPAAAPARAPQVRTPRR